MVHKIDLELDDLEFTDLFNGLTEAVKYYQATNGTPNQGIYRGDPKRCATLRDRIWKSAVKNCPEQVGIIGEDGVERPDPYWLETHSGATYTPRAG
jgi:hypothetical protein